MRNVKEKVISPTERAKTGNGGGSKPPLRIKNIIHPYRISGNGGATRASPPGIAIPYGLGINVSFSCHQYISS